MAVPRSFRSGALPAHFRPGRLGEPTLGSGLLGEPTWELKLVDSGGYLTVTGTSTVAETVGGLSELSVATAM